MLNKNNNISFLEHLAYKTRRSILEATTAAGSGHPTSCLSAADIAVALFFYGMKSDDHFVLSKGHAAPLLYALYEQMGIISHEEILQLRTFNSVLEGHPTPRFNKVCVATGSLGQGLSIGLGMVLGKRVTHKTGNVYVLLGDGETAEGSIWEAAEIASHYHSSQLIALLDSNRWGQSDQTLYGHRLERIQAQWEAFGWHTLIIDGHAMHDICSAYNYINNNINIINKPIIVIARTLKGHGLNGIIEDHNGYHGKAFSYKELPGILETLKKNYPAAAIYTPTARDQQLVTRMQEIHKKYDCKRITTHITLPQSHYTMGEQCATRKAFGHALVAAGTQNNLLIVYDADVKNSTFTEFFEQKYPEKFFQSFVAEQNMISMALGSSVTGTIACASTFAAFYTRAHDQLRMAGISRAPLHVIGSHAGVSIGQDGPSQMGLEDIALFRSIPDSIILYPCDAVSTYYCTQLLLNYHENISYLRTTRSETPVIYNNNEPFMLGGCKTITSSAQDSLCIIAAGITVFEALKAYEICKKKNIFLRIIDCYSIKPLPIQDLMDHANVCNKKIITVEDHYIQGGLGESIAYALRNNRYQIECLAVTKLPSSGTPEELRAFENIDATAIIKTAELLHVS